MGNISLRNRRAICLKILFLCIGFFVLQFVDAQNFKGPYIDMVYHPNVKTVQLYPNYGLPSDVIRTPTKPLNDAPLTLEFDVLGETQYDLMVEIIHLNKYWLKSNRNVTEYLDQYNEFRIFDVANSFNTKVEYIHYKLNLPKVSISGNYMVVVYKANNPNEVFLTKRFMIYEDIATIIHDPKVFSGTISSPFQYLNFEINYEYVDVLNTPQDFYVVVRKNGMYNQEIKGVKPTFNDQIKKTLTFNLADEKYQFIAGNQYRIFDLRSTQIAGINVKMVDDNLPINTATLLTDEPRVTQGLRFYNDINGMYQIDHYEFGDGSLNGDYVYTYFVLRTKKAPTGDVYVYGALSNWKLEKDFKMIYNEENNSYYCRPLIKQGYYNYEYVLSENRAIDFGAIEGSYNQTENLYEVFLYTEKPGTQLERLVGYKQINLNTIR